MLLIERTHLLEGTYKSLLNLSLDICLTAFFSIKAMTAAHMVCAATLSSAVV